MKVSKLTLIVIAVFVWLAGGVALLFKGGALVKGAYLIDAESVWTYASPVIGIVAGVLKGIFLFGKSCKKNIKRIRALDNPRVWQCFRPGMLIFLALIIPTGAWMSRASAGSYTLLCLVGALDLSISFALLTSTIVFFQLRAFSTFKD